MTVNIMVRVKFRFLGIDIGTLCKLVALTLSLDSHAFSHAVTDFDEKNAPTTAKKMFDTRGVLVKVWR